MNVRQKLLIVFLILVLLLFFFPKKAGWTCGWCPPPPAVYKVEYGCIGLKYEYQPPCIDCGKQILCFGIVTKEKKCYTKENNQFKEVPCSSKNEAGS